MLPWLLSDLDAGFTREAFWVNVTLQLIAATAAGAIALGGALLVASRTLKQQIAHDLQLRRQDDAARHQAEQAKADLLRSQTLMVLAAELASTEAAAADNQTRHPGYMTALEPDSIKRAIHYFPSLPPQLVADLLRANRAIVWFNSLPSTDSNRATYNKIAGEIVQDARRKLDMHLGTDHEALAVALPVRSL